jgi:hypothetical protein
MKKYSISVVKLSHKTKELLIMHTVKEDGTSVHFQAFVLLHSVVDAEYAVSPKTMFRIKSFGHPLPKR